ncbi:hypothetical protein Dimus_015464, partial [Dionaea muscipula]
DQSPIAQDPIGDVVEAATAAGVADKAVDEAVMEEVVEIAQDVIADLAKEVGATDKPGSRVFGFGCGLAILRFCRIRILRQANPVDRTDGNRSTGTFDASLPGCVFLQGRHPVDRMRGGTVDRLLKA